MYYFFCGIFVNVEEKWGTLKGSTHKRNPFRYRDLFLLNDYESNYILTFENTRQFLLKQGDKNLMIEIHHYGV